MEIDVFKGSFIMVLQALPEDRQMYQDLRSLFIRSVFGICLIVICLLIFASDSVSGLAHAPKIFVETPVFDFESVDQGTVLKHAFKIFNHGDAVLNIKNVRPG
jgi:hypothetical protein